jgi:hypothetical protein
LQDRRLSPGVPYEVDPFRESSLILDLNHAHSFLQDRSHKQTVVPFLTKELICVHFPIVNRKEL